MHVQDDIKISEQGINLNKVTKSKAKIATVWAGAPAYYSRRAMIDLLGKNDREIASRQPIGKFYPGHNKWDYDYSIKILKPDVVYQLWKGSEFFKPTLFKLGYVKKCFFNQAAYFLNKSENINWFLLDDC